MGEDWVQIVDRRISALETHNAVDEVHRHNVERRLRAIEDMLKWLVRLVIGAVLMGMLGYALAGGFVPGS